MLSQRFFRWREPQDFYKVAMARGPGRLFRLVVPIVVAAFCILAGTSTGRFLSQGAVCAGSMFGFQRLKLEVAGSSGIGAALLPGVARSARLSRAHRMEDNASATDPLGTATGTIAPCSPGGLRGRCYAVTISCPNVADFTAAIKVTPPAKVSVGTVIFTTGGGGEAYYDAFYTYGPQAVSAVVAGGFTAVQSNFSDPGVGTDGWLSGPGGPRKLACRYATLAQWVYTNIHRGGSPFCATGNSGGSAAVAYSLAHYGLGSIFNMVEPTSGPPLARIDYGCICNQPAKSTPCGQGLLTECYGLQIASKIVDPAYGDDICSDSVETHSTRYESVFLDDSVASPDGTFAYPTTNVHFIFGGQDRTQAVPQGLEWYQLITTQKSYECVLDAPHNIPDVQDGAAKIASDLIADCHL